MAPSLDQALEESALSFHPSTMYQLFPVDLHNGTNGSNTMTLPSFQNDQDIKPKIENTLKSRNKPLPSMSLADIDDENTNGPNMFALTKPRAVSTYTEILLFFS